MDLSSSVLIVESNGDHRYLIEERLLHAMPQAQITTASSLANALEFLPMKEWGLVILNTTLPDGKGTTVLEALSNLQPFAAVIVLSETGEEGHPSKLGHRGPMAFLRKDRQTLETFTDHIRQLMTTRERLSHLSQREEGLKNGPLKDPLTNLYSRTYFDDLLKREVDRANRHDQEFALLIVDIDNFKDINSKEGRHKGDRLLRELAGIVRESIRKGDIIARYGPDELIILLDRCLPLDAMQCANRILANAQNREIPVPSFTVSIGLLHYQGRKKVHRLDRILSRTQRATNKAKRQGGNCWILAA